jgi:hypothetical protein
VLIKQVHYFVIQDCCFVFRLPSAVLCSGQLPFHKPGHFETGTKEHNKLWDRLASIAGRVLNMFLKHCSLRTCFGSHVALLGKFSSWIFSPLLVVCKDLFCTLVFQATPQIEPWCARSGEKAGHKPSVIALITNHVTYCGHGFTGCARSLTLVVILLNKEQMQLRSDICRDSLLFFNVYWSHPGSFCNAFYIREICMCARTCTGSNKYKWVWFSF